MEEETYKPDQILKRAEERAKKLIPGVQLEADLGSVKVPPSDRKTAGSFGVADPAAGPESDDEDLAPPASPSLPTPTTQGSSTAGSSEGPAQSPRSKPLPEGRSAAAPSALILPSTSGTPKTTGKGSAASQASDVQSMPNGSLSAAQKPLEALDGESNAVPATQQSLGAPADDSGKFPETQKPPDPIAIDRSVVSAAPNIPDAQNQPAGPTERRNGEAVVAGAALAGTAASGGAPAASGQASGTNATGVAAAGTGPGGPGTSTRPPSGLTPLPPIRSRVRRKWRRNVLLIALLVLLIFLVLSVAFASVYSGVGNLFTPSITAQVTIMPASKLEQNNYLLAGITTGTPDPAKNQVLTRTLKATSPTQLVTGNGTGKKDPTVARGVLFFISSSTSPITLQGTTLTGKDGVQIRFDQPVTIPPGVQFGPVDAYAVNPGAKGNIPAFDIFQNYPGAPNIVVRNMSAFNGGSDPVLNLIQQSDIDNAVQSVAPTLKTTAINSLRQQMKSNENAVDSTLQCSTHATADPYKVGQQAPQFPVQVSVTCTEEVYDYQGARQSALGNLQNMARSDQGASYPRYQLDGPIAVSLISATPVASAGQLTIDMQAMGLWVYQFTDKMLSNLKQTLSKLSKQDALSYLQHYMGVDSAQIILSSGNTMPANVSDIELVIQKLLSPQATITPGPQGNITPVSTLSGSSAPTPTPDLGGS